MLNLPTHIEKTLAVILETQRFSSCSDNCDFTPYKNNLFNLHIASLLFVFEPCSVSNMYFISVNDFPFQQLILMLDFILSSHAYSQYLSFCQNKCNAQCQMQR